MAAAYQRTDDAAAAFMAHMEKLVPQLGALLELHAEWIEARKEKRRLQETVKLSIGKQQEAKAHDTDTRLEASDAR